MIIFGDAFRCVAVVVMVFGVNGLVVAEPFARLQPDFPPGFSPELSGTEAGLWMQVEDAEEAFKHSPNRIADPALDTYIHDLICRLNNDYCADIRVYVMRVPHFNAFMMPNGGMQVWSGLLLRMRNEAQLAAVLGHEMGHFLRRHSLRRFQDAKVKTSVFAFLTLGVAGAVAAGGVTADTGRMTMDVTQLAVLASIFAYSRDNEGEADQFGVQMLYDAGLEPAQAPEVWTNLIAEEKAADHKRGFSMPFFTSHPDPGERTKNLMRHADGLRNGDAAPLDLNAQDYREIVWPHMKTWLEDEINLRQYGRTEHLLKELLADHVAQGQVNFALGELYRVRGGEGDADRARQYYTQATNYPDHPAEVHRSLGLIYYKNREMDMARDQFREYLDRAPDANDREMIEYYMASGG